MSDKEFTSMAQKRRFEHQQKELERIKMEKLAKTESQQAMERMETVENIMEQMEKLSEQPLSWYELSELEKAHGHLKNIYNKLSFDYHLEAMKVDPECQ